jgi:hypothetical protein
VSDPLLSDRDTRHLTLSAVMQRLPVFASNTNL